MKFKMLPVFTADALAELVGETEDDIRSGLFNEEYYNDSCIYWGYDEDFDPNEPDSYIKNLVNKKLRELDLPNYGVVLIDVSW